MTRAIDPVTIRLADGKDYHFFLSHAALRRAARRLPADSKDSPMTLMMDLWAPVFYEACEEKSQISFEDFEEIWPGSPEFSSKKFKQLERHCTQLSEDPTDASGNSGNSPKPTGSDTGPQDGNVSG